jgi:8-oxo-dGTP diphosphatase
MEAKKPGIGVNVFIYKGGKILLGKRKGGTAPGTWCLPGGKLEFGEGLRLGAKREVREETGIEIESLEFVSATNDPRPNRGEHYIHFNFRAETESEPSLTEPDNFTEWKWFDPHALPQPIFYGHKKLLEAFERDELFSD